MNPTDPQIPTEPTKPSSDRPKLNWPLFLTFLLSPALLTGLSASTGQKDLPVFMAVVGGGIAGIICGVMLGRRIGITPPTKVGLSILFSLIFMVVCVTASCFGCFAGGYNLRFQ